MDNCKKSISCQLFWCSTKLEQLLRNVLSIAYSQFLEKSEFYENATKKKFKTTLSK